MLELVCHQTVEHKEKHFLELHYSDRNRTLLRSFVCFNTKFTAPDCRQRNRCLLQQFSLIMTVLAHWILNYLSVISIKGFRILTNPWERYDRINTLTKDMRLNKWSMYEHIIFMVRRLLLVLLVIFCGSSAIAQITIFSFWWLLVIAFKLAVRPFKRTTTNIQDIVSEFLILSVVLLFLRFLNEDTKLKTTGSAAAVGYLCISLIVSIALVHYIFESINLVNLRRQYLLKKKVSKGFQSKRVSDSTQIAIERNASLSRNTVST